MDAHGRTTHFARSVLFTTALGRGAAEARTSDYVVTVTRAFAHSAREQKQEKYRARTGTILAPGHQQEILTLTTKAIAPDEKANNGR